MTEAVPAPRRRVPWAPILIGTGVLACLALLGALTLDGLKPSREGLAPSQNVTRSVMYGDTQVATKTSTPVPSSTPALEATITALAETARLLGEDALRARQEAIAAKEAEQIAVQEALRADVERKALDLQKAQHDTTSTVWAAGVTETAQAGISTLTSAQLTSTEKDRRVTDTAPQRAAQLAEIELERATAPLNEKIRLTYQLCVGTAFLLISVAAGGHVLYLFLERKRKTIIIIPENLPNIEPEPIPFVKEYHAGGWTMKRGEVPCTEAQLYEFCDGLINGGKSLAFLHWRGAESLWTQPEYAQMRNFLQWHRLADSTGMSGELALNDAGTAFIRESFDAGGHPPAGFVCAEARVESDYACKNSTESVGQGGSDG